MALAPLDTTYLTPIAPMSNTVYAVVVVRDGDLYKRLGYTSTDLSRIEKWFKEFKAGKKEKHQRWYDMWTAGEVEVRVVKVTDTQERQVEILA